MRLAQFTLLFSAFVLLSSIMACNKSGNSGNQSASDDSKILLRLNLDEQGKMNYVVEMDYKTSMDFMGATQEMDMDMLMEYSMDVKEKAKDGITLVDLTTNRMKMNVDMPLGGGSLKFDSENPDASDARSEMMAGILGNYIGESLEIKINERAGIEAISGQEKISEKMKKNGGGMVGDDLQQMFGDNLNQNFEAYFVVLPENPVGIGDTWESTIKSSFQSYPMVVNNKYKMTERKDGIATVKVEAEIAFDKDNFDKEKLTQASGGHMENMEIDLNGKQTGVMKVNENTGWTISTTIDQELDMEVDMGFVKMPMKVEGTISFQPQQHSQ